MNFRALLALAFLSACSGSTSVEAPDAGAQPVNISVSGTVVGGLSPVVGSTVQLYAANTVTGTASTALAAAVTTGASGAFAFSGVSCPGNALVYVLATGGIATGTAPNQNLALMTALGACASSAVVVNEVTTVAAASALSRFLISPTALSGGQTALTAAFSVAAQLANPATGTSPGVSVPAGTSVPTTRINALGNIVSGCVESAGGSAGDRPQNACGLLFSAATPDPTPSGTNVPSNTVNALINIANTPLLDAPTIFASLPLNGPFAPQLRAAPANFLVQTSPTNGLTIDHGNLALSSTASQLVTFTNGGAASVTFNAFVFGGNNPGSFSAVSNLCTGTLAAGASCSVALLFTPAVSGAANAVFTAQTSAGDLSVNLSGG